MGQPFLHERMLRQLTPEQGLAVEVLRQAVRDAQHAPYVTREATRQGSWQWRQNAAFAEARAWFVEDRAEVEEWLELLNLPTGAYGCLLRAAGLEETR